MKKIFVLISSLVLSSSALPQMVIQSRPTRPLEIAPSLSTELTQSIRAALRPAEGMGQVPRSTFELVASSDLVVRGRWGKLIRSHSFLGYGVDPVEFQREHRLTDLQLLQAGLPFNDFEIIVDEVLMGEIEQETLVLRVMESPGLEKRPDLAEFRQGTHLLFLVLEPDGKTYGLSGTRYDQRETPTSYEFLEQEKLKTFEPASDKAHFEQEIGQIVSENAGKIGLSMQ